MHDPLPACDLLSELVTERRFVRARTCLLVLLCAVGCNRNFELADASYSTDASCTLSFVSSEALGRLNPPGWQVRTNGILRTVEVLPQNTIRRVKLLFIVADGGIGLATDSFPSAEYRTVPTGGASCFEIRDLHAVCGAPDGSVVIVRPLFDGGSDRESWAEPADLSGGTRLVYDLGGSLAPTSRNTVRGVPGSGPSPRWFFTGKSSTTIGVSVDSGTQVVFTASAARRVIDLPGEPKGSVRLQTNPAGITHLLLEDDAGISFFPLPPPQQVPQLRVPNATVPGEEQIVDFEFDGGTYGLFVSGTQAAPAAQVLRLVRCSTSLCDKLEFAEVSLPAGPYTLTKWRDDKSKNDSVWFWKGDSAAFSIDLEKLTQSLQRCYP
jgi:hypothetical protein